MAIKDEYEVARLYTDGSFERQLAPEFACWGKLEFHLAPPLLARRDRRTGRLKKPKFGPWMMRGFRLLARLRVLRGSCSTSSARPGAALGAAASRRIRGVLDRIENNLPADKYLAGGGARRVSGKIRGYGHVKDAQAAKAIAERERLMMAFAEASRRLAEAAE